MEHQVLIKRFAALMAGVAVAVVVAAASFVLLPDQDVHDDMYDYGYVYSGAKSSSVKFIKANLRDDSLLVLGSSEFSTPASSVPQIPAQVFGTNDFGIHPMLVGEAFDQCLWDSMAIGALADGGLPRNKVVLIIGLGQFTDGGLDNSSFGERFSYTMYQSFCANKAIPAELKSYVRERLAQQGIDETSIRAGMPDNLIEQVDGVVLGAMDDLSLRSGLSEVRSKGIPSRGGAPVAPNWDALRGEAMATAMQMSTTNDWGIEDEFYTSQLAPVLEDLKDARKEETYTDTPEYDDLDCFLSVCDACGIQPLIVIQPSLGPYYDHIGILYETRFAAYQHMRDVVAAHPNARLADFSDREYERYFLFDIVHFGWTGWIDAEHAMYDFAMEGVTYGAQ